jgi:hypothetical protein
LGSVVQCHQCWEFGHNTRTCENEVLASKPLSCKACRVIGHDLESCPRARIAKLPTKDFDDDEKTVSEVDDEEDQSDKDEGGDVAKSSSAAVQPDVASHGNRGTKRPRSTVVPSSAPVKVGKGRTVNPPLLNVLIDLSGDDDGKEDGKEEKAVAEVVASGATTSAKRDLKRQRFRRVPESLAAVANGVLPVMLKAAAAVATVPIAMATAGSLVAAVPSQPGSAPSSQSLSRSLPASSVAATSALTQCIAQLSAKVTAMSECNTAMSERNEKVMTQLLDATKEDAAKGMELKDLKKKLKTCKGEMKKQQSRAERSMADQVATDARLAEAIEKSKDLARALAAETQRRIDMSANIDGERKTAADAVSKEATAREELAALRAEIEAEREKRQKGQAKKGRPERSPPTQGGGSRRRRRVGSKSASATEFGTPLAL